MNIFKFLRILLFFIALIVVVFLGVQMDLETTHNYPDIKLISGIVTLVLLWPAYKLIDFFQNKTGKKSKM